MEFSWTNFNSWLAINYLFRPCNWSRLLLLIHFFRRLIHDNIRRRFRFFKSSGLHVLQHRSLASKLKRINAFSGFIHHRSISMRSQSVAIVRSFLLQNWKHIGLLIILHVGRCCSCEEMVLLLGLRPEWRYWTLVENVGVAWLHFLLFLIFYNILIIYLFCTIFFFVILLPSNFLIFPNNNFAVMLKLALLNSMHFFRSFASISFFISTNHLFISLSHWTHKIHIILKISKIQIFLWSVTCTYCCSAFIFSSNLCQIINVSIIILLILFIFFYIFTINVIFV